MKICAKSWLSTTSRCSRKSLRANGWFWSWRSMAVKSVYLPEPIIEQHRIHITGDEHRHLSVARAEANETIEIFDGKGNVWTTEVESMGKRETVVRVTQSRSVPRDPLEVILALAMIRIPSFELALEKVVEVG